jgi:ubiquinone/menaquinone biosynthesis C-methylase UbiE
MSTHERRFDPTKMERLESPERGQQFPIHAIMDAVGVCGMLNVADIGAGTGYFTLPIAERVAPGKVFAVDPSTELLDVIRGKLSRENEPKNVELVAGDSSATGLVEVSCDLIFLSAVWHEIDDYAAALREFSRIATPNAKLAIVDWSPDAAYPPGPPLAHRIALSDVERTLEEGGWSVVKSDVMTQWTYIVVGQLS